MYCFEHWCAVIAPCSPIGYIEPLLYKVVSNDPSNRSRLAPEHNRFGTNDRTLPANTVYELPVGDTRRDKERVDTTHEIIELVYAVAIQVSRFAPRTLRIIPGGQLTLHETTESLDRTRSRNTLWAPANTHTHINARFIPSSINSPGNVPITNEPSARPRRANIRDELLMTRAIKHRNPHFSHRLPLCHSERPKIFTDRLTDINDSDPHGIGDDLIHIEHRRSIQHGTTIRHRNHRQRILTTRGGERRSINGIHRNITGRTSAITHPLTVEQHWRFILLSLANNDHPVKINRTEKCPHGINRGGIRGELVTATNPRIRTDGRSLRRSDQLDRNIPVGVHVQCFCIGHLLSFLRSHIVEVGPAVIPPRA